MFAVNPGVLAAGVGGAKTYAEFVAHITALATNGERAWSSSIIAPGIDLRTYRTTPSMVNLSSFEMFGSSWGPLSPSGFSRSFTSLPRAIQHAMPSEAAFNDIRNGGYQLLYTITATTSAAVTGGSRNGYRSNSLDDVSNTSHMTEVLAWIDGRPMRMQPSLGLGPEPYDW